MSLDALSPVERTLFVVWSLFSGDLKGSLKKYFPAGMQTKFDALESSELTPEILQVYLSKLVDFQHRSFFLGMDDSWVEKNPVLREISKNRLTRMSQHDDLVETGRREISAYLVSLGKRRTATLLAYLPKDVQEAVFTALSDYAPTSAGDVNAKNFDFIFQFNYLKPLELFKQAGLYAKDPAAIQQLAQRLNFADGQKLLTLLKK
ncbi:MAG: hypothetical protein V4534_09150 [Myxococcota bacterium]